MPKPLRVAIAGCHRMLDRTPANHNWAAAFAAVPETELVAVFDKGADTRAAFVNCWGDLPAYADYERMLQDVSPEIVCIATRQTRHADQIELAAAAGVQGILCDKPLATSLGEVARIVAAAERSGIRFAFGLDRRWVTYYDTLGALIQDGAIGEVRSVAAYGLVNLINHGCHWYDRVLAFAGDAEIAWVSGRVDPLLGEPADSRRRLDPPGSCQIQFANGVQAFVTAAGYVKGFDPGFDVIGSRGRLTVVSDGVDTGIWSLGEDEKTPVARALPPIKPVPHWPRAVQDLVSAIRDGHPTRCDIAHARRATEIGFVVHQSDRQGGRRIAPAEVDPNLRVASFPWGNE
ncbi:MAG TPA: Gfo/Idh/MocA family oxidoreductase [Chloroflexota bacterium]|nr:Gfo/Idh/MocA family oxidoreductase [Chloroflexota bacterium]